MAGSTFVKKVVIGTPIKKVTEILDIGNLRDVNTNPQPKDGYVLVYDSANTEFVTVDSVSLKILKVTK